MDDLRRRFASLDHQPTPDLWDDIERLVSASSPAGRVVLVPASGSIRSRRPLALLLAAALLLAGIVIGALVAGSGPPHPLPAVVPSASPIAEATSIAQATPATESSLVVYTTQEQVRFDASCTSRPWRCMQAKVLVAERDGTVERELLPDKPDLAFLAWSPDGSQVLGQDSVGNVIIADFDGSASRILGNYDTLCHPRCTSQEGFAFSPDGTRLAFSAGRSPESGDTSVIAIFDLASGEVTELESTATRMDGMFCDTRADEGTNDPPQWSPDGTRLVFARQLIGPRDADGYCQSTIYTVGSDGTGLHALVPKELHALNPHWSPDGTRIAFHSADMRPTSSPDADPQTLTDVYTIRPDGTDLRRLTSDGVSSGPAWTQDGRIVYLRWLEPQTLEYEPWIMDGDGGGASRLEVRSLADLSAAGCVVCPYPSDPTAGLPAPGPRFAYWQPTH
jgi:sugar lactone lactonase YvrE